MEVTTRAGSRTNMRNKNVRKPHQRSVMESKEAHMKKTKSTTTKKSLNATAKAATAIVSNQISLDVIFNDLLAEGTENLHSVRSLTNAGTALKTSQHKAVFVVGATGSGKSTTINYLSNVPLAERVIKNEVRLVGADGGSVRCEIGHENISKTLVSSFVPLDSEKVTLVDTAGFGENRSMNHALVASFALLAAMKACTHIDAVCFDIEYSHFEHPRLLILDELHHTIAQMFRPSSLESLNLSNLPIHYFVTKAPKSISVEVLRAKLNDYIRQNADDKSTNAERLKRRTAVLNSLLQSLFVIRPLQPALHRTILEAIKTDPRPFVDSKQFGQVMTDYLIDGAESMMRQIITPPTTVLEKLSAGIKECVRIHDDLEMQVALMEKLTRCMSELSRTGDVTNAKKERAKAVHVRIKELEAQLKTMGDDLQERDLQRRELTTQVSELGIGVAKEITRASSDDTYNYLWSEERSFKTRWVDRYDRCEYTVSNARNVRIEETPHQVTCYYTPVARTHSKVTLVLLEDPNKNHSVQSELASSVTKLSSTTRIADALRKQIMDCEVQLHLARSESEKLNVEVQTNTIIASEESKELSARIEEANTIVSKTKRSLQEFRPLCAHLCRNMMNHVRPFLIPYRLNLFAHHASLGRQIVEFLEMIDTFIRLLDDLKSRPEIHRCFEPDPLKIPEFAELRSKLHSCRTLV